MLPMSVRETSTLVNRGDFVLDELELEHYREGRGKTGRSFMEGRLLSTGESYVTDRTSIVGLDLIRQLKRENRVRGFRAPVRYLPKQGRFWPAVDRIVQFRVLSREEFDLGFPVALVAANLVFVVLSVMLIRRGAGFPARPAGESAARLQSAPAKGIEPEASGVSRNARKKKREGAK